MVATIILLALFAGSLALRVRNKKRVESHEVPEHTKPSPLSQALQELIATAGGIYLSLVLLVSFLKIDLPEYFRLHTVEMDPLAFAALVLAFIQPLVIHLYSRIKGGK